MLRSLGLATACLLAACTDDPSLDPGRVVATCTDCTDGALAAGRFFDTGSWVAASPSGHVVRADKRLVTWLDATFAPDHSAPHGIPGASLGLAVGADGSAAVFTALLDINATDTPGLAMFDPDGNERWRIALGDSTPRSVAIGESFVFIGSPTSGGSITFRDGRHVSGSWVIALDRATGALAWSASWTPSGLGADATLVASLPDGGVAVGGNFTQTLALGGDAPALSAAHSPTQEAGFVSAFDATGRARWAVAPSIATASVIDLAAGPGGEVAIAAAAHLTDFAQSVALLAPDGTLRWSAPAGRLLNDFLQSLVTNGTTIYVAGAYGPSALGLDPDQAPVLGSHDGWIAAFGGGKRSLRWLRTLRGAGSQQPYLLAATSDRLLAAIGSWSDPGAQAAFTLGDVAVTGNGQLIGELVR